MKHKHPGFNGWVPGGDYTHIDTGIEVCISPESHLNDPDEDGNLNEILQMPEFNIGIPEILCFKDSVGIEIIAPDNFDHFDILDAIERNLPRI